MDSIAANMAIIPAIAAAVSAEALSLLQASILFTSFYPAIVQQYEMSVFSVSFYGHVPNRPVNALYSVTMVFPATRELFQPLRRMPGSIIVPKIVCNLKRPLRTVAANTRAFICMICFDADQIFFHCFSLH